MGPKRPGDNEVVPNQEPGSNSAESGPQSLDTDPTQLGKETTSFPIVGIGASAGGLEALEALTKRLSADGMAFVVLQHLAPGHESVLTDILARDTSMKVVTVKDGMPVDLNHIYVAPPNVDLAIHQRVLRLMTPASNRRGPRLSIDAFFRSLAADQGGLAIGVLLSGAGTDGTLGLKAIKEEGGITFVQEPSTAGQPSMPQSALDAGYADFCLSPEKIGDELMCLSTHPYVAVVRPPKVFDEDVRSKLFVLLRDAFGVDFAAYKQTTIERRIQRRMALHKLERLEDYVKYLEANVEEMSLLYSDLLIGVTGFFRDKEPFEVLQTQVFPRLLENRRADLPLRIWVAGCATGEEAFSIAIIILELLGERAPSYKVQIFATDIDEQSLTRARLARYPQNIETELSPDRLVRFFSRSDKGYQVSRTVRNMVLFARHNLGKDPPYSRIDLVSCRNVLIYMQPALQKKILRIFHYALNPDAFLLLGTSESVGEGSDLFSLVDRKGKLYTKKNIAIAPAFDLAFGIKPEAEAPKPRPVEYRHAITVLQLADRKVLDQYGPPGVVVNERFDILQYRGKTGRFFEPSPGIATINLLKLTRPELLPELRPVLHRALSENIRVVSNPVRLWHDKESIAVRMDVTPLATPEISEKSFLVLFNEQRPEGQPAEAPVEVTTANAHVEDLERELATTKEYLQTTIEDLEATNEELQSSNEELQSSNEELQSTNEELETSKEELQSTNEELVTLNEELQNRMAQLNVSNDDLQNLLDTSSSVMLLVGVDLRIRRFSATAEKLLHLIPGDVGRSVAYIRTVMKVRDIEQTVSEAISTISSREQKVRCVNGYWYTMRITPYRTADHMIRGAVLEFIRVAAGEKSEESTDLRGLGGAILAAIPGGLALLDERMCLIWANNAFLDLFEVKADIFGRPLEDFWSGKVDQPDVWKLLEDTVADGRPFKSVLIVKPYGEPLKRAMRFSARRLPRESEHPLLTLLTLEEEPNQ
jgi:two-component system CheB/CheR fusion protein